AKLASLAWLPLMLLVLAFDVGSRPLLKTKGPWLAVLIALLCTTPIFAWNARHEWVTFRHVGTQTGVTGSALNDDDDAPVTTRPSRRPKKTQAGPVAMLSRMGEFAGSQIAVIGPGLLMFM